MDAGDGVFGALVAFGQPDAETGEIDAAVGEDLVRSAVGDNHRTLVAVAAHFGFVALLGDDSAVAWFALFAGFRCVPRSSGFPGLAGRLTVLQSENDDPVDHVNPWFRTVFDEHHGRVRTVEYVTHRADDLVYTVRIEVGSGLVQQQDARLHGECSRKGEALHLPAA